MFPRGNQSLHDLVRIFVTTFDRNQSQTTRNAKDMGVHWEDLALTREQQNTGRSLWADSFERCQELPGFVDWDST